MRDCPANQPTERAWLHRYADAVVDSYTSGGRREPPEALARWLDSNEAAMARKRVAPETLKPSPLGIRIAWMAKTLGLNKIDTEILGLLSRIAAGGAFRALASVCLADVPYNDEPRERDVALMLRRPVRTVAERLDGGMPLRSLGLVQVGGSEVSLSKIACRVVRMATSDPGRLQSALLGDPSPAALRPDDYAHVADAAEHAVALVRGALAARTPGVNILLAGPVGSGKTEFAKVLAEEAGAQAFCVGERDDDGDEPSREDRVAALAFSAAVMSGQMRAVLVVDEADDLFAGVDEDAGKRKGSKVFMNRLVETLPKPAVFIVNDISRLGAATVRRMSLVVRFPPLSFATRTALVGRVFAKRGLRIDGEQSSAIARLCPQPSVVETAARAMAVSGSFSTALASAESVGRFVGPKMSARRSFSWNADWSVADHDLRQLACHAVSADASGLAPSILMVGPNGAGRSGFAQHWADRCGRDVRTVSPHALTGPWSRYGEAGLEGVAEEAAEAGAMFLLRDADLVMKGRDAVPQVGLLEAFLRACELHRVPIAALAPDSVQIDPDAVRRFVVRVRFSEAASADAARVFRAASGLDLPPCARRGGFVAGDVRAALRRAALAGRGQDAEAVGRQTLSEAEERRGASGRRIGFGAAA